MNSFVKKIVTLLVSLFLISYVIYQGYSVLYNPIRTVRAESGTFEDDIKTEGFVLHNESVITQSPNGIVDYLLDDGEAVAKGGQVAAIYKTAQDASNQHKIQQMSSQIQQYQQIGSQDEVSSIDVDVLDSEIEKNFLQLSEDVDGSSVDNIETDRSALLTLLDKKQLATGEIKNFNTQIAQLQQKEAALSKETGSQIGTISAPAAGYFVSEVDGLENIYNSQNALTITAENVKNLLSAATKRNQDAVGKVITGFQTYIVCNVSADDSYKLKVGSTVTLNFPLSSVVRFR